MRRAREPVRRGGAAGGAATASFAALLDEADRLGRDPSLDGVSDADATSAAELERIVADSRRLHRAAQRLVDDEQLGLRRRWRDDGRLEVTRGLDAADGLAFDQQLDRLVDVADARTGLPDQRPRIGDTDASAGSGAGDPSLPDGTSTHGMPQPDATLAASPDGRPLPARAADALLGAVSDAVAAGPDDASGLDRHLAVIELTAAQAVAARR